MLFWPVRSNFKPSKNEIVSLNNDLRWWGPTNEDRKPIFLTRPKNFFVFFVFLFYLLFSFHWMALRASNQSNPFKTCARREVDSTVSEKPGRELKPPLNARFCKFKPTMELTSPHTCSSSKMQNFKRREPNSRSDSNNWVHLKFLCHHKNYSQIFFLTPPSPLSIRSATLFLAAPL